MIVALMFIYGTSNKAITIAFQKIGTFIMVSSDLIMGPLISKYRVKGHQKKYIHKNLNSGNFIFISIIYGVIKQVLQLFKLLQYKY